MNRPTHTMAPAMIGLILCLVMCGCTVPKTAQENDDPSKEMEDAAKLLPRPGGVFVPVP